MIAKQKYLRLQAKKLLTNPIPYGTIAIVMMRKEVKEMMNPVINVGTKKNPMMVLCANTMIKMYEEATGKKFGENMDDYMKYCDGYCDAYNEKIISKK